MARHHTRLDKALDLKPKAFALMRALVGESITRRHLTAFYPDHGWPSDGRVSFIENTRHQFALFNERHAEALSVVSTNNRDTMNANAAEIDGDSGLRIIARMPDVLIPGHTLSPVDIETGRQIDYVHRGPSRWPFAHPAPAGLREIRVDNPVMVVPPIRHYGHTLTDVLMPLFLALQAGDVGKADPIILVTARKPLPVVEAAIEGLRKLGMLGQHLRLAPWQRVRASQFIYAKTHCRNVERIFAAPDALPMARRCFEAAYDTSFAESPAAIGEAGALLYLTRGKTRLRQVEGEAALIEMLTRRGFEVFEARHNNHAEQIARFAKARVIVGVHGAGLANVLFSHPGARLIEIMAMDGRKSTGLHWAAEAGLSYTPLVGSAERGKQHFAIDAEAVARQIDAVIGAENDGSPN
jgi:hypothetical protein